MQISLNLHDGDGVRNYDNCFEEMCKIMGIDPKTTDSVKFQSCGNITYAYSLEDRCLKPLEDLGVNSWWVDWG